MEIKLGVLGFLIFMCEVVLGDPGRDLCKVIDGKGLKCSAMSSYYFPYDTFLSFNDDIAQFTSEMKYLEIENSNISVLQARSFQRTPYLSHIILSGIFLMEIEPGAFEGLKRLKLIDLSRNLLHTIPVDAFKYTKVVGLKLDDNALLDIPTNGPIFHANFLTTLSLKNCNIQHLPGSAFQQSQALVHLDLSQNHLKMLPQEIFAPLNHLTFLDLSNNQFQTLDIKIFESMPSFPKYPMSLLLSDNPWTCDCKIAKLASWATKNIKSGTWSKTPMLTRLRRLVECQQPSKIFWNSLQFKELISSC